jgi:hypothetical protein
MSTGLRPGVEVGMAQGSRNGNGRETSMFGLLLPVLLVLVVALVLNAFSDIPPTGPEPPRTPTPVNDTR